MATLKIALTLFSIWGIYSLPQTYSSSLDRAKPSAKASNGFVYMSVDPYSTTDCLQEAKTAVSRADLDNIVKYGFQHCASSHITEGHHLVHASMEAVYVPKHAAIPYEILKQLTDVNSNPPPQCLNYAVQIEKICPHTWSNATRYSL